MLAAQDIVNLWESITTQQSLRQYTNCAQVHIIRQMLFERSIV